MIVEQRIYTLVPGMVGKYMDFYTKQGQAIQRPQLGRFLGYYYSEIGTLNQVIHMWAYKDLGEREARRAKQNKDERWIPYAAETRKIIVAQENHALTPIGAWSALIERFFDGDSATGGSDAARPSGHEELTRRAVIEWTATRLKWGAIDVYRQALERYEQMASIPRPGHVPMHYLALSGPQATVYSFQVFDSFDEREAHLERRHACPAWAALKKAGDDCIVSRELRFLKPFDLWIPELGALRRFINDHAPGRNA